MYIRVSLGNAKNYSDSTVANAKGVLRYNENNLSYEIASEEKLKNMSSAQQLPTSKHQNMSAIILKEQ